MRVGAASAIVTRQGGDVPPERGKRGTPSAYFEPVNWHRTVFHELGHNAERRIMRHGQIDGRQRLTGHAAGSA
jgi:hypothetical protein